MALNRDIFNTCLFYYIQWKKGSSPVDCISFSVFGEAEGAYINCPERKASLFSSGCVVLGSAISSLHASQSK